MNKTDSTTAEELQSGSDNRIPQLAQRVLRRTDDVQTGLNELALEIKQAVIAIDPTCQSVGVITTFGENGKQFITGIILEYEDLPMIVHPSHLQGESE